MCTHLSRRGSIYYFRRVIPVELRPFFHGRIEWMESLKTKDRHEAKQLVRCRGTTTDTLIKAAQEALRAAESTLPPASPPLSKTGQRELSQHEIEAMDFAAREVAEEDGRLDALMPIIDELESGRVPGNATEQDIAEALQLIMRHKAWESAVLNDHLSIARSELRAAKRQAQELQTSQADRQADVMAPAGTLLDPDIIDKWAAERKIEAKGVDAHRAVARWFHERVGDMPIEQITKKDVIAFKDKLIADGASAANTNTKLQRLRALLNFAVANDVIQTNPAHGISVAINDKQKAQRTPFPLEALRNIFDGSIYAEDARPFRGRGEAAYWLPLMALYTGARMEELGQLRPEDVFKKSYLDDESNDCSAWFIRITEDENAGLKLKNAASQRVVPVHPALEANGFVRFAQQAKAKGQARLFLDLKPNKYGKVTAKWGEWFSGLMRDELGITDKRLVFHSFRYTFKHYAAHVQMVEGVQREIMGHTSGDVADKYRGGYTHHQLVEGMRKYRVPGFAPPPPPPAFRAENRNAAQDS